MTKKDILKMAFVDPYGKNLKDVKDYIFNFMDLKYVKIRLTL